MTSIQHVLSYLRDHTDVVIASHDIEIHLSALLRNQNIFINPGTLSRKFRMIREKANEYGLSFEEFGGKKEKVWKVTVFNSDRLNLLITSK